MLKDHNALIFSAFQLLALPENFSWVTVDWRETPSLYSGAPLLLAALQDRAWK